MGDSCWFRLTCLRKDLPGFRQFVVDEFDEQYYQELLSEIPNDYDEVDLEIEEMNYGGEDKVQELAEKKLTFFVDTGRGDNYDEEEKVCFFGELVLWVGEGYHVDTIIDWEKEEITADQQSIDWLKNFVRVKNLTKKYFDKCEEPEFLRQLAIKILTQNK
jgi:hypothetical protein